MYRVVVIGSPEDKEAYIASRLYNTEYITARYFDSFKEAKPYLNEKKNFLIIYLVRSSVSGDMLAPVSYIKNSQTPCLFLVENNNLDFYYTLRKLPYCSFLTFAADRLSLLSMLGLLVEKSGLKKSLLVGSSRNLYIQGSANRIESINYNEILYLTPAGNHCELSTSRGVFHLKYPFSTVLKEIVSVQIVRISRTFAVNLQVVNVQDDGRLDIRGYKLKVGPKYQKQLGSQLRTRSVERSMNG